MTKPDIRFTWTTETTTFPGESPTTVFKARVGYMERDKYADGEFQLFWPQPWSGPLAGYADLIIRAQRNDGDYYGWGLEYSDVYSCRLGELETKVKTLRGLERKLDRMKVERGYPLDLADYCGRVAAAVGADPTKAFSQRYAERQINGTYYRWGGIDQLRSDLAK